MRMTTIISNHRKVSLVYHLLRDQNPIRMANHDFYNVFLKSKSDIEVLINMPLSDASILVLGCGYHYPEVILYSTCSKHVVGLDIEKVFYRNGFAKLFRNQREAGKGILKSFYSAYSKRYRLKEYYSHLGEIVGTIHHDYGLVSYSGESFPFEDNQFDVVLSNAVFEHVADLKSFFRELHRVTKATGLSYHNWHNYYSFSGSHLPSELCLRHPWGHLRGIYEANGLNKAKKEDIRDEFSLWFDIIDICQLDEEHYKKGIDSEFTYEREDLLTADIRSELQPFSDDELLTRAYLIIGRKKELGSKSCTV